MYMYVVKNTIGLFPHIQSVVQYSDKMRMVRVRTLDGAIRTLLIDDSQTVSEITRNVCAKFG